MTQEEISAISKLEEESQDFFYKIMEVTQHNIDALTKQLEEARAEDEKRIDEMEKKVKEMTEYRQNAMFAIETAKYELSPFVFAILYDLTKPVIETLSYDLSFATMELRKEKERFNNSYKSLR